jgi:phosphoribosylaminoimidazole-succinocarboxamide synthase
VLTSDSSRYWDAATYAAGGIHRLDSFDKQIVRDWLDASGWDHEPPPPELPTEVVDRTSATYLEAYERITGEPFSAYRARMGLAADAER